MTYNFKATMLMILKALRGFLPADADCSSAVSDIDESLSCARSDVMNRKISPRNQENVSRTDFRQLYPLSLCIRLGWRVVDSRIKRCWRADSDFHSSVHKESRNLIDAQRLVLGAGGFDSAQRGFGVSVQCFAASVRFVQLPPHRIDDGAWRDYAGGD